jgi:hypothetical protein
MVTLQTEEGLIKHLFGNLEKARRLATGINGSNIFGANGAIQTSPILDDSYEPLRWFVYPADVVRVLKSGSLEAPILNQIIGPVQPQRYLEGYFIGGIDPIFNVHRTRQYQSRLVMNPHNGTNGCYMCINQNPMKQYMKALVL